MSRLKRRGVTLPPPIEVLEDDAVDTAVKKVNHCCVDCGATSTPQWREGPDGPKTLCNACGVRRQRLLRKLREAAASIEASAPVAAAPARRRGASRFAAQASSPADGANAAMPSMSEQLSDETDQHGDWAANVHRHDRVQKQHQQHLQQRRDSTQEEESAAYDLLFFAGVEPSPFTDVEENGSGAGNSWRSLGPRGHGHNTRRQAAPQRRNEDFYYYGDEPEPEPEPIPVSGLTFGIGGGAAMKRRRMAPPPPPRISRRVLPGSSASSSEPQEPFEDTGLASAFSVPGGSPLSPVAAPASWSPRRVNAATGLGTAAASQLCQDFHDLLSCEQPLGLDFPLLPARSAAAASAAAAAGGGDALALSGDHGLASLASPLHNLGSLLPPPRPIQHRLASPPPAPAAPPASSLPGPLLSLTLPLPLSSIPVTDLALLARVQAELQESLREAHRAEAACEAIGAVYEEQRAASAAARQAAATASHRLAAGARSVAERYPVRSAMIELRDRAAAFAAAAGISPPGGSAAAAAAFGR